MTFKNQINNLKTLLNKTEKNWKDLEGAFKEKLAVLDDTIKKSEKKIKELNFLLGVEEISEEEFKEETKLLNDEVERAKKDSTKLKARKKKLTKIFEEIKQSKKEKRVNKKKLLERLTTLEDAHKNSTISEAVYTKLKQKYQEQLKDE